MCRDRSSTIVLSMGCDKPLDFLNHTNQRREIQPNRMQISCQLLPLQIIDQASCFTSVQCFRCQGVVIDKRRDEMMRGGHLKFLLLPHAFLMEWIDLQSLFARVYMGTILVDWIRVELERLDQG